MKHVSCVYLLISINCHDVGYNDVNPSRAIDGCIRPCCSNFGPNCGYIRQEFKVFRMYINIHPFKGVLQMIVLTYFWAYSVLKLGFLNARNRHSIFWRLRGKNWDLICWYRAYYGFNNILVPGVIFINDRTRPEENKVNSSCGSLW